MMRVIWASSAEIELGDDEAADQRADRIEVGIYGFRSRERQNASDDNSVPVPPDVVNTR
jgi:hypothetical protein